MSKLRIRRSALQDIHLRDRPLSDSSRPLVSRFLQGRLHLTTFSPKNILGSHFTPKLKAEPRLSLGDIFSRVGKALGLAGRLDPVETLARGLSFIDAKAGDMPAAFADHGTSGNAPTNKQTVTIQAAAPEAPSSTRMHSTLFFVNVALYPTEPVFGESSVQSLPLSDGILLRYDGSVSNGKIKFIVEEPKDAAANNIEEFVARAERTFSDVIEAYNLQARKEFNFGSRKFPELTISAPEQISEKLSRVRARMLFVRVAMNETAAVELAKGISLTYDGIDGTAKAVRFAVDDGVDPAKARDIFASVLLAYRDTSAEMSSARSTPDMMGYPLPFPTDAMPHILISAPSDFGYHVTSIFKRWMHELRPVRMEHCKTLTGKTSRQEVFDAIGEVTLTQQGYEQHALPIINQVEDLWMMMNAIKFEKGDAVPNDKFYGYRHDFMKFLMPMREIGSGWRKTVTEGRPVSLVVLFPTSSIREAFISAWESLRNTASGKKMEISIPNGFPPELASRQFEGDNFDLVKRWLRELIANSIKHSGGNIVNADTALGGALRDIVYLEVTDDGHGMSSDTLERKFGKIHTAVDQATGDERLHFGTVEIVDGVRRMFGDIDVKTSERGTRIGIVVPIENIGSLVVTDPEYVNRIGNRPRDFTPEGVREFFTLSGIPEAEIDAHMSKLTDLSPRGCNGIIVALYKNLLIANLELERVGLELMAGEDGTLSLVDAGQGKKKP